MRLKKNSSNAVDHLQLGRVLVNLEKYDAAERSLKQSLSIGGEDVVKPPASRGGIHRNAKVETGGR
ncbi:MAG TPA: hypothetical protein VKN18_13935 [Blastocatellia bacterium]|nr:hypothetical protein [Blastocatellia bacterium]